MLILSVLSFSIWIVFFIKFLLVLLVLSVPAGVAFVFLYRGGERANDDIGRLLRFSPLLILMGQLEMYERGMQSSWLCVCLRG